jgi:hypothetical protein
VSGVGAAVQRDLVCILCSCVAGALAAAIAAGPAWRRWLGLSIGIAALAIPAFGAPAIVRGVGGLWQTLIFVRVFDLFRDRRPSTLSRRLAHAFSAVDTRLLRPAPRRFDARGLLAMLLWAGLCVGGVFVALAAPRVPNALFWPVRWLGGLLMAYGLVEALWAFLGAFYAGLGFATPALHTLPLVSRSVQELWGRRWSQVIRQWLQVNIVRIWARHGALGIGVLLAFAASGAAHGYVVLISIGPVMALSMLGFFVLQGVLVGVERRLGVLQWRPLPAHAWVISVMLLSSPLFTEAMLRCMEI